MLFQLTNLLFQFTNLLSSSRACSSSSRTCFSSSRTCFSSWGDSIPPRTRIPYQPTRTRRRRRGRSACGRRRSWRRSWMPRKSQPSPGTAFRSQLCSSSIMEFRQTAMSSLNRWVWPARVITSRFHLENTPRRSRSARPSRGMMALCVVIWRGVVFAKCALWGRAHSGRLSSSSCGMYIRLDSHIWHILYTCGWIWLVHVLT